MVNAATVIPISLRFPPLLLDPLPASTFAADDTTNAVSFHSLAVGLSTLARFALQGLILPHFVFITYSPTTFASLKTATLFTAVIRTVAMPMHNSVGPYPFFRPLI
jgi:hypothetical protein